MDIFLNFGYKLALFVTPPVTLYFIGFNCDWYYIIKYVYAYLAIRKLRKKNPNKTIPQQEKRQQEHQHECFHGIDQNGNSLSLTIIDHESDTDRTAKISICLRLASNISVYSYPTCRDNNNCDNNLKFHPLINSGTRQWKSKELTIEILEPLMRFRITFNGFLKKQDGGSGTTTIEPIQFNFIWNVAGAPQYYPEDASLKLLASAVAHEHWTDGNWLNLLGNSQSHQQFGALRGFVKIHSLVNDNVVQLNLAATHKRYWSCDIAVTTRSVYLFIAAQDGTLFDVQAMAIQNGCSRLVYGTAILSTGEIVAIDQIDLNTPLNNLAPNRNPPDVLSILLIVKNRTYYCTIHLNKGKTLIAESSKQTSLNVTGECTLNMQQAHVLGEFHYYEMPTNIKRLGFIKSTDIAPIIDDNYVINLQDNDAATAKNAPNLCGGKGISLIHLHSIRRHLDSTQSNNTNPFHVPNGFVVTTTAFRRQFTVNFKLKQAVLLLDEISCARKATAGDLKAACSETVKLIENETIIEEIAVEILRELNNRDDVSDGRWAVRSSAIGEDSPELSSAGQNATFLGCYGVENVFKSIQACWASLFTYQSVQYRRQHGLAIYNEMAVVVQRMVPADVAGVLFTCHPTTADPSQIVITSNFGLGESVVSGSSNTDSWFLSRNANKNNPIITVASSTITTKKNIIKMAEDPQQNGVIAVEEASVTNAPSLHDSMAIHLAQIAVLLEEFYECYVDIEWAYYREEVYLLQARPITTVTTWHDTELLHEFDTPILSGSDTIHTRANIGEVFPGVTSTLSLSTTARRIELALQVTVSNSRYDWYAWKCFRIYQNHLFLDVIDSLHRTPSKDIRLFARVLDLAVFGHPVIDERINSIGYQRYGGKWSNQVRELFKLFRFAWSNDATLHKMIERMRRFHINIKQTDSIARIYLRIDRCLRNEFHAICQAHARISATSVFYQIVAMNVMLERSQEITDDHYGDFAMLLSTCNGSDNNVMSADVPKLLDKIADILKMDVDKSREFAQISASDGVQWLRTNWLEVYDQFKYFLKMHGHRTIGELDMKNKPWSHSPSEIIKIIQRNCEKQFATQTVQGRTKEKVPESLDDIIKQLKTPKSSITRMILKVIMRKGQRAVSVRERSKSTLVMAVDRLRHAYNVLAQRLTESGRLPTADLIHHLSHAEIKQIIDEPQSPLLINKALRRQRLYPTWNKLIYREISFGSPEQVAPVENNVSSRNLDGGVVLARGTAVCRGSITARACVIITLDDIDQLKTGDILITYSTDIGWSPYFPILAGIVTELGGLISHGAVVAREYGLPCVVGVVDATKMFRTGDLVSMSGDSGVIEVISRN